MSAHTLGEAIDRLLRVGDVSGPLLSLYLDCSSRIDGQGTHLARLKTMIRESEPLAPSMRAFWVRASRFSLDYVRLQLPLEAQGLALFFCEDPRIQETIPLRGPIADRLAISHSAQLDPLIELQAAEMPCWVLVVHNLSARLYRYDPPVLTLTQELEEVVEPIDGRQDRSEAYLADHSRRFLSRVVSEWARIQAGSGIESIVLLGTDENRAEFRKGLPPGADLVLECGIPPHRDHSSLSMEILRLLQRTGVRADQADPELVQRLRDRLGQRHRVASGVSSTLFHLQAGNLEHLFLSSRFSRQGSRCKRCGFVFGRIKPHCSYCGGDISLVQLRNRIERLAEGHRVPFHFLESPSFLDPLGGTAGFLRDPALKRSR